MNRPITPNNNEVLLADDEFIVSKGDAKGRITYINRVFMQVSGYSEQQSLGNPHSMVRHPDMPRGAYYLMWKALQAGEEFFALVKNLCADGSYYWVFANVTADYDSHGELKGYYSVRRKASDYAKQAIAPIYQEMLRIEAQSSASEAPRASAKYLLNYLEQKNMTYHEFLFSLVEELRS